MTEFQLAAALEQDCFVLGDLPLCRVLLMNDSQYPWFILVPRRAEIQELFQMNSSDQREFMRESSWFGERIMQHFNGDKLNVAALGNMVPQLHVHHVVRFQTDPAWPKPVWGASPAVAYTSDQADELIATVRAWLDGYSL
ncbi:HIT domain-containing protein [Aliidiomarina haloalkalitolerans]|uniref:HIT family protein n=1 Tax=Aliidiomarina haloalkalitolerans TaxID=859059 RepID=A0A432VQV2_9GAMM|nr:HIT domain-containing protein [Aliidiomarina haloalkalitolerans]RUO18642.1 HIT family protein [Aliidiomarina haloalkalitolerans]